MSSTQNFVHAIYSRRSADEHKHLRLYCDFQLLSLFSWGRVSTPLIYYYKQSNFYDWQSI